MAFNGSDFGFPSYPVLDYSSGASGSGSASTSAGPSASNGKRSAREEDDVTREALAKKARLEAQLIFDASKGNASNFAPQHLNLPGPTFASAVPQRVYAHGPPRQLQAAPTPPPSTYHPSPGPSRAMTPIPQPQFAPRPPPPPQPQPQVEIPPLGSSAERDYRRALFLAHFRDEYFMPLLPPGRNYFTSHPRPAGSLVSYTPQPQPQAIQGTMKSYQVREQIRCCGLPCWRHSFLVAHACSWPASLSSPGCTPTAPTRSLAMRWCAIFAHGPP